MTFNQSTTDDIIVIYHGYCTDGFGAAFAAWKKFGNNATYIARDRKDVPFSPSFFKNKEVYVVDYSFSLAEMIAYQDEARSFMVIDHHISAKNDVESLHNHIFNNDKSGAYLAWEYFHPETKVPKLIEYISDADIWAHTLPDWQEIESFIYSDSSEHFTFEHFQKIHDMLETEDGYSRAKEIGTLLLSSFKQKVEMYVNLAELVEFEGHKIYAVNASRDVRSQLGHILAEKTNSFSLLFTYELGTWKCSLRSVKDFDVSTIATKYGGGGHKNAAAFMVPAGFPLPFANSSTT
jgi:nanoRNase/pAp phosphatase (c-di-AMP/oligoRNAs hydrolase)